MQPRTFGRGRPSERSSASHAHRVSDRVSLLPSLGRGLWQRQPNQEGRCGWYREPIIWLARFASFLWEKIQWIQYPPKRDAYHHWMDDTCASCRSYVRLVKWRRSRASSPPTVLTQTEWSGALSETHAHVSPSEWWYASNLGGYLIH